MIWNISNDQLGLATWLRTSQVPHTCLLAENGKLQKDLFSNNYKCQHYQHYSHTKSKRQQLLGGELTLSQLKPGHPLN